jgi:hypothetical protein
MNMEDVRRALWKAYKKAEKREYGIEGKSSEAWCELQYPTYWDAENEDDFIEPCGIMIYSYALGTSRQHYIKRGKVDKQINYYTWQSPDIFRKAVEVINEWADNISD